MDKQGHQVDSPSTWAELEVLRSGWGRLTYVTWPILMESAQGWMRRGRTAGNWKRAMEEKHRKGY